MRATVEPLAYQQCINPDCGASFDLGQSIYACPTCGQLLDINYRWDRLATPKKLSDFQARWANRLDPLDHSGVWRFRELLPFLGSAPPMTIGEGQTTLQQADELTKSIGMNSSRTCRLFLQYEGFNPSGSFKDNGMAAAFSHARMVGAAQVA